VLRTYSSNETEAGSTLGHLTAGALSAAGVGASPACSPLLALAPLALALPLAPLPLALPLLPLLPLLLLPLALPPPLLLLP
jgi:hypothetical protein